jgi:class 3 adenylate cyclase
LPQTRAQGHDRARTMAQLVFQFERHLSESVIEAGGHKYRVVAKTIVSTRFFRYVSFDRAVDRVDQFAAAREREHATKARTT